MASLQMLSVNPFAQIGESSERIVRHCGGPGHEGSVCILDIFEAWRFPTECPYAQNPWKSEAA